MINEAKSFCEKINIEYNDKINVVYDEAVSLYNEKGDYIICKERIINLNNEYNIFRLYFDDVLKACDEIKKDEDIKLFIYLLICAMKKDDVSYISMPDKENIVTDFAPLFAFMYFFDDMIGDMKKRGLPHDVISDTLNGFDSEITDYVGIFKRPGIRIYVSWFMLFFRKQILRVGRLQFQIDKLKDNIRVYKKGDDVKILIDGEYIHNKGMILGSYGQEDESEAFLAEISDNGDEVSGYSVNEYGECVNEKITLKGYDEILKKGDYILRVHIPSDDRLDYEMCEVSYKRAQDIFVSAYKECDFKAFACTSWLLEKRLKLILGKETNITRFADKYMAYPIKSGAKDVYQFLYSITDRVDANLLPEKTSLHKKVKEYLLDGNIYYEKAGVILF